MSTIVKSQDQLNKDAWQNDNDGAGSGLDADTVDGVQGALLGIGGDGYSWVNETANRALGTTYANTTGKPIAISTYVFIGYVTCQVDGVSILTNDSGASNDRNNQFFIVPYGSTYSVNSSNASITK